MTDVASRELSCKHGKIMRRANTSRAREPRPDAVLADKETRSEPSWALRDPLRAVLGARRPVWRPSWALRGPSRGHLERQETGPEAVLGARRAVQRLSWTPGGPSAGRLSRQEARMQVLLQFCCKMQVLRRRQSGVSECKVPKSLGISA